MKTRIGLIGPKDSIERAQRAATRFEGRMEFVIGQYESKEESVELVRGLEDAVDVILFTGIIPYLISTHANATAKPCLYMPRVGTSVIKTLWLMRNEGVPYDRISIDSIDREAVEEAAEELGFAFDSLQIVEYEEGTSYEDLAARHEALLASGLADSVMTGLTRTHDILRAKGLRCYKIYPTKYIIRESIQKAIYVAESARLKSYQIAVMILSLEEPPPSVASEYDFLGVKNAFERILIAYAKRILGSVFPSGRDEYILFATRGALDDEGGLATLFSQAEREGLSFKAGLGYGTTAYNAESNARKALSRSSREPGRNLFAVDVDGLIEGPISTSNRGISYALAEGDAEALELARRAGLSPAQLAKIRSIVRMTRQSRFDADEIAAALDLSPRSARRVLQGLAEAGLAEVAAVESRSRTGRPRRLYTIRF